MSGERVGAVRVAGVPASGRPQKLLATAPSTRGSCRAKATFDALTRRCPAGTWKHGAPCSSQLQTTARPVRERPAADQPIGYAQSEHDRRRAK